MPVRRWWLLGRERAAPSSVLRTATTTVVRALPVASDVTSVLLAARRGDVLMAAGVAVARGAAASAAAAAAAWTRTGGTVPLFVAIRGVGRRSSSRAAPEWARRRGRGWWMSARAPGDRE